MSKRLTIGLFGFGVVGQGLNDIIKRSALKLMMGQLSKAYTVKDKDMLMGVLDKLFNINEE